MWKYSVVNSFFQNLLQLLETNASTVANKVKKIFDNHG